MMRSEFDRWKAAPHGRKRAPSAAPPIAVGGVGGSGTRLVAWVLLQLGVKLPGPLNDALDNLWFTLLFKRRGALIDCDDDFNALASLFLNRLRHVRPDAGPGEAAIDQILRTPRQTHSSAQMQAAAQSLLGEDTAPPLTAGDRFGWKEPNTHVFLERFVRLQPNLQYIHVMRHGMDMALSGNQNQMNLWGPVFLDRTDLQGAGDSLAFWRAAHERIDRIAALHENRILMIKFEDLCTQTIPTVREIAAFLGLSVNDQTLVEIDAYCTQPQSSGRRKKAALASFAPADVEYVASKGYPVD